MKPAKEIKTKYYLDNQPRLRAKQREYIKLERAKLRIEYIEGEKTMIMEKALTKCLLECYLIIHPCLVDKTLSNVLIKKYGITKKQMLRLNKILKFFCKVYVNMDLAEQNEQDKKENRTRGTSSTVQLSEEERALFF